MEQRVKARLQLYGRFRFEAPDGTDISPKSAKSQALIALLATNETGSRGRLWLQKRLWPNSDADRAATSLRQSLSEIRRALGDHRELLQTDRRAACLALDTLDIAEADEGAEFMEGLGLPANDHALDDWLAHHRGEREAAPPGAPVARAPSPVGESRRQVYVAAELRMPVVVFRTLNGSSPGGSGDLGLIEDIFVDSVARSMRETLSADVRVGGDAPSSAFRAEVQAFRGDGAAVGIRARVHHGSPDRLVWSGMTSTQLHGAPPVEDLQFVSLGNQLIDALAEAMTQSITDSRDIRDANLLTRLAIRRIFCLRPEALVEADEMLLRARELGAGALSTAWRAQLRVIQHVERHETASPDLPEEARRLCIDAMEREPMNSMVLAAVANTRLVLDKDVSVCLELARRSVSLNPANPLAWNSLATAKLYAGEIAEAHALAVRAQKMSSGSPFGHWWDFGRCLTAALTGRRDEALRLAEAAHALSPEFRPPLRYLTALYAAADRPDDAIRVGERLRRLEPDFSFERLAMDDSYPVSPLRWSGLLDSGKVMELSG